LQPLPGDLTGCDVHELVLRKLIEQNFESIDAGCGLSTSGLELLDVLRESPCPGDTAGPGGNEDRGKKEAEDPRLHVILDRIPKEISFGSPSDAE
jgi:hypothetical protein